jgi:hypothetical protein
MELDAARRFFELGSVDHNSQNGKIFCVVE